MAKLTGAFLQPFNYYIISNFLMTLQATLSVTYSTTYIFRMMSTASSVHPDATTSQGIGSTGALPFSFSFSFLCSRMWALAPPNPNELTPARQPFQGCFSVTTYST